MLPALYGRVIVPPTVLEELNRERTPEVVRRWLANRSGWLHVQQSREPLPEFRIVLGDGEREPIALAVEVRADALLMDDRDGRREAERLNYVVLGTLRVLADAARYGLIDLRVALERLRQTNFRADDRLIQQILDTAR